MVVAYKKLTLEKNALEETLKTSLNYEKDDLSETASEVQKFNSYLIIFVFGTINYKFFNFNCLLLLLRQFKFNIEF